MSHNLVKNGVAQERIAVSSCNDTSAHNNSTHGSINLTTADEQNCYTAQYSTENTKNAGNDASVSVGGMKAPTLTAEVIDRIAQTLPKAMLEARNWCCYKLVTRDGRQTKIPCDLTGKAISGADASYTFEEVAVVNSKVSGLGFALRTPFAGYDVDDCLINGKIEDVSVVEDIESMSTYCESSPSGTGIHAIFMVDEKPDYIKRARNGNRELYFDRRFFTVTGNELAEFSKPIRTIEPEELVPLYKKIDVNYGKEEKHTSNDVCSHIKTHVQREYIPKPSDGKQVVGGTDAEIIGRLYDHEKSKLLFTGEWQSARKSNGEPYGSQSEADMALLHCIAVQTDYDWFQSDAIFRKSNMCRPKWDELRGNLTYGEITMRQEFRSSKHTDRIPDEVKNA